jgi:RNA methyltransferase, TrmH family
VLDALDAGWTIRTLIYAKAGRGNATVEKGGGPHGGGRRAGAGSAGKGAGRHHPPRQPAMVAAVFEQRFAKLSDIRPAAGDVWVALDRVRDPGNLGTIIRTVDAVGAKGVILVGDTTDPYSLETVRATMGSLFSVPLAARGRKNSWPGARAAARASSARIWKARSTIALRITGRAPPSS